MMLKKSAPGFFNSQAWYRHVPCATPEIQSKKYGASARRFTQLLNVIYQHFESSAPHERPCAPALVLSLVLMVALPVTAFAVSLDAHPELQSFIQAMVTNHGVCVGVPLPIISYGGSSLVTLMAAFGILMSIQTHRKIIHA